MEHLLDVNQIMERYHLRSRQTAAKRMHEMDTMIRVGRRLLVPADAVERYDRRNETHPPEVIRAAMRRMKRA